MAKNDIRIHDRAGYACVPTWTWQTEAAATAILAGEPVKLKSAGSPYVIPLADSEPVIGTTTQVIGIAATDSTQTATANGTIEVYMPLPGVVYAAKATTLANVDTKAELDALVGDRVEIDLTGSTYTLDENAADGVTGGCQIVGGDYTQGEVYFILRSAATEGPVA